jgi:integrase
MSTASREPDYRDPACRSWRFTPARIDAACRAVADGEVPTDASGRVQWRDAETKGLFLRVTSNGHGTFTLFYKKAGKPIRKAIGIVGEITLGEAREAASALRYDRTLAAQVKPRERRGEQVEGLTVGEAFDGYIDAAEAGTFTMGRRKQPITDRTAQGYRDCYAATLKAHADRPLAWLAENVVRLHREMGAASGTGKDRKPARPYQGNRMLQLARSIFAFAAREGRWTAPNPCVDPATGGMIAKHAEHHRNRILHDEEEARLGTALLAEPLLWRDLFGLALLTGRRMSAVCRMRWGDVDLSRRLWVAPREEMKGRKAAHGVPLDSDAVALLKRRKAMAGESEWVFPAVRSPGPVASWKTAWGRIRDAAGLGGKDRSQRVRPHDLRRSWGSRLIEAGAPTVTVNQLMGNSPSSVGMTARVYMQIPDAVQIEAIDGAFRRRQARKAKARPTGEKKPRGRQKKSDAAP